MNTETVIGIIGMSLILLAFIHNELKIWSTENLKYDLVNLIGSLFLIYYAFMLESLPFLILNFVWAIFSLKDIVKK